MLDNNSSTKRIAKNSFMLYLRMLLSMVVSLYTSRVVLATLGIEDYGIYNVVGGVVGMFSFLNATMSGATSRFLTFEMGKGDSKKLMETFSSALIIHFSIAIVIFILAETVGIWFLMNKLVIPESRMFAAQCVFQLSIISMAVGVTQVPYNASIIAHEKMDVYAYVEILNVILKLLIVYLLVVGNTDKLILYGILTLVVTIIIAFIYRIYCVKHFAECHFFWVWNKSILKGLLSFSTYNFYGNMGSVVNAQSTNFVLNHFFGVILNSAASIATTVSGVVNSFASNIMVVFRPQITKNYAKGDLVGFQNLLDWAIKIILLVYVMVAIPVFVEIDILLTVWLENVPPYTTTFCRCILVSIFFETLRYVITIGIHAVGKVKMISLFTGSLFLINPFVIYFVLLVKAMPDYVFYSVIVCNLSLCVIDLFLLKKYIPEIKVSKFFGSVFNITLVSALSLTLIYMFSAFYGPSLLKVIYTTCISVIVVAFLFCYCCMDTLQRKQIFSYVKSKINRKKHG